MRIQNILAGGLLAALAACGGGGGGSSNSGGTTTDPSGKVTIAAVGPSSPVGSGGQAQFDVTIQNSSSSAVPNVVAQLTLGSGLTRTGVTCTASNGATCPADASTMTVASLPAGGTIHFLVLATVTPGTRGALTASASVSANGAAPTSAEQVPIALQAFSADVQVTAQAPTGTQVSGTATAYTMTVTNAGPDASTNLTLQDNLDSHQTIGAVTCVASGGATCPSTLGGAMAVPSLPAGGTLVFTVPATIAANAIGNLTNSLYATPTGDPVAANNAATATTSTSMPANSQANFVTLQSDAGDYIGAGQSYAYSNANAQVTVTPTGGHLHLSITGNDSWSADFAVPNTLATLQPGSYQHLTRYPFDDATVGGLSWIGNGRGCNTLTGNFTIDKATYSGSTLTALDLRFEQHCNGVGPALRGQIHWVSTDTSVPPGPTNPVPATLWHPAAGATPASGNYVYLQSDAGDYIGGGATNTYTPANAVLGTSLTGTHLGVSVTGNDNWTGDFQGMNSIAQLQPGYYPNLTRYPFHNPATGGLSWSGDGRGCNTLTGWFAIDSITIASGAVTAIDLRFEQHCEGATAALHGQVHWVAGDTTGAPGPVNPPPANLWTPTAGATPATGNYVYLQSDLNDYVGGGLTNTYTQANAVLSVTSTNSHLAVTVTGNDTWSGDFQGMNSLTQLQPGYYPGLQRFPFNNPVTGGLDWGGDGRGCNTLTGWFVVDSITYTAGALTAVDLRFEQHCEGGTAALHGKIHWVAGDTTAPTGPQTPPAGLWTPPAGATPATGNYVYLNSDIGDYIGGGSSELDTAGIAVSGSGKLATVTVNGVGGWAGNFLGMNSIAQLQAGYYPNLMRYPFNNPVTGGLDWSGNGRGCNTLTGWFVIDGITYDANGIASLDLRFEQHCEGGTPALHGQVHWTNGSSGQITH